MNLTIKNIYDKSFKTKFKGYNPIEVDTFLDDIISDYETYEKQIDALKREIIKLRKQLENTTSLPENDVENASNFDILKRISNLEKHVFGSKLNNL